MSTTLYRRLRPIVLISLLCGLAPLGSLAAPPTPPFVLWTEGTQNGQWIAFGKGTQDSESLPNDDGMRIIVDWKQATFGVGARYAADPKNPASKALPRLGDFHKLQLQARSDRQDQTTLTVELVMKGGRDKRAEKALTKTLTSTWQTFEFNIPTDFGDLSADDLANVDAIQVLFINPSKAGDNTVEFKKAILLP